MVPATHTVALAHTQKMGLADVLLTSIDSVRNRVNTHQQNWHYAPLFSTYLNASKFANAGKCDIAHGLYIVH